MKEIAYGLIGNPLEHSFSPAIHAALAGYDYQLYPMSEAEMRQLLTQKNFKGLNVTIPYKEKVIPFLDEISPLADKIGTVNTIVNHAGSLYGYNTDICGLRDLLIKNQIELQDQKVLILGTGGTAKTALELCKLLKAKETVLVSRQKSPHFSNYQEAPLQHRDATVIINTTPCGMASLGINKTPVNLDDFPQVHSVIDVIYNPLRSKLLLAAEKRRLKTCNGLYMLIMQAFYAAELFSGKKLDPQKAQETFQNLQSEKQNIVLIGMPSSGKTTIAQVLAEKLKRPVLDVDQLITEQEQLTPREIIEQNGEAHFRKIEQKVISALTPKTGQIIATGGGSILDSKNVDCLKANGILYFLDRSLEKLIPTASRPLSASFDALAKKYEERYTIYLESCDCRINADADPEQISQTIIKKHFQD